eukprot:UN33612
MAEMYSPPPPAENLRFNNYNYKYYKSHKKKPSSNAHLLFLDENAERIWSDINKEVSHGGLANMFDLADSKNSIANFFDTEEDQEPRKNGGSATPPKKKIFKSSNKETSNASVLSLIEGPKDSTDEELSDSNKSHASIASLFDIDDEEEDEDHPGYSALGSLFDDNEEEEQVKKKEASGKKRDLDFASIADYFDTESEDDKDNAHIIEEDDEEESSSLDNMEIKFSHGDGNEQEHENLLDDDEEESSSLHT